MSFVPLPKFEDFGTKSSFWKSTFGLSQSKTSKNTKFQEFDSKGDEIVFDCVTKFT